MLWLWADGWVKTTLLVLWWVLESAEAEVGVRGAISFMDGVARLGECECLLNLSCRWVSGWCPVIYTPNNVIKLPFNPMCNFMNVHDANNVCAERHLP